MTPERCMAVTGTVYAGPSYCGNRAKHTDPNGRPVCGVHKAGNPGIAWHGNRANYPEGTHGLWSYSRGPS